VFVLEWLEVAVSWVLVTFHSLLAPIFGAEKGITWALSIVGLVIVIRIALIPVFVRQIKAQRGMQLLQPKMKEIQTKYAGDRNKQSEEMMKLYKETGTNPLSSCLPLVLQAPIFYALFQVLQGIAQLQSKGVFQWEQYAGLTQQAHDSLLFGLVPLYATFKDADQTPNPVATRILCGILVVLMTATTFLTQRQLMVKNMPAGNPMAQQQKILLYVFPLMFAFGGFGFPVGVLIYWLTTNLWSMGQQFWVIRNNPTPGTPAFDSYQARVAQKEASKVMKQAARDPEIAAQLKAQEEAAAAAAEEARQREQPKKQTRSQRSKKKK